MSKYSDRKLLDRYCILGGRGDFRPPGAKQSLLPAAIFGIISAIALLADLNQLADVIQDSFDREDAPEGVYGSDPHYKIRRNPRVEDIPVQDPDSGEILRLLSKKLKSGASKDEASFAAHLAWIRKREEAVADTKSLLLAFEGKWETLMGRLELSVELLEKAIEVDPENEGARLWLLRSRELLEAKLHKKLGSLGKDEQILLGENDRRLRQLRIDLEPLRFARGSYGRGEVAIVEAAFYNRFKSEISSSSSSSAGSSFEVTYCNRKNFPEGWVKEIHRLAGTHLVLARHGHESLNFMSNVTSMQICQK